MKVDDFLILRKRNEEILNNAQANSKILYEYPINSV